MDFDGDCRKRNIARNQSKLNTLIFIYIFAYKKIKNEA